MSVHDLYQPFSGSYNSSASGTHRVLNDKRVYYEPEVLLMGQVVIHSSRQPKPLMTRSMEPHQVPAQVVNARVVGDEIAQHIRHMPSFESIYVKVRPWGLECWIIANQTTEADRFALYDLEWQMMEHMSSVGFKFNLVDRQNRPLDEIITLEPADAVITL